MVETRIKAFNGDRDPQKVLLKYKVMRQDAFRFFRGTAHLFYEDLHQNNSLIQGPVVWMCGDLHIENFGSYKGSDGLVYFDMNDFDEAILGPAGWELVRLYCSVVVAGHTAKYSKTRIQKLTASLLQGYTFRLKQGKDITQETATSEGLIKTLLQKVEQRKEKKLLKQRALKARKYIRLQADDQRAFTVPASNKKEIIKIVNQWLMAKEGPRKWKAMDVVFRIAGTGSIGIDRYIVLIQNNVTQKKIMLDLKRALPSSLEIINSIQQPIWKNEADRIVQVQYRMQHMCPAWLDCIAVGNSWFVIKEIQPTADKIDFTSFKSDPISQEQLLYNLGQLTASAQLRSGGRQGSVITDTLISFGSDTNWQQSLIEYANSYAVQVAKYFREFSKAFDKGYFR